MRTISLKKQAEIDAYLAEPVKAGDRVQVMGLGSQDKTFWGNSTNVEKVLENGDITITEYTSSKIIEKSKYRKWHGDIGVNPFPDVRDRIENVNFTLESILFKLGLTKEKEEKYDIKGITIKNVDFNPYIFDDKGEKVFYQRPLVWALQDKQNLIESIYNNVDCGKILIRRRGWDELGVLVEKGEKDLSWSDVVDGKQRLHTIKEFINDEFPDSSGNYFGDLSANAQSKLLNHQLFSYSELPESISDKEVINQFLKLNFAGVPQSKEHVDFVKEINLK